jgi:hypothetical protein
LIDKAAHYDQMARDELRKVSFSAKESVGWSVQQMFAPMPGPNGQMGLFLCWVVTVTLKAPLLGYEDLAFPVLIPGTMANDQAITESTSTAFTKVIEMRDKLLRGEPLE